MTIYKQYAHGILVAQDGTTKPVDAPVVAAEPEQTAEEVEAAKQAALRAQEQAEALEAQRLAADAAAEEAEAQRLADEKAAAEKTK